ncbi:PD40 domain-containing protein [Candidatus Woesebacteria bacterium]|nr:PD40 domain-containing protein [Candidatus Woesebacteria bacterium]
MVILPLLITRFESLTSWIRNLQSPTPVTVHKNFPITLPTCTAKSGSIVFSSDRSGNYDLYVQELSTGKIENKTATTFDEFNPQVSSDGAKLVYYANRYGNTDIFSMVIDSGATTQLTDDPSSDYDATFAFQDPDTVVFKSNRDDGFGDLFSMSVTGELQTNLTVGRKTSEEWKPEFISKSVLVFSSRLNPSTGKDVSDELFTLDLNTNVYTQLTSNSFSDWYPAYDATSNTIVYVSRGPNNDQAIYRMNPDGTGNKLVIDHPGDDVDPSIGDNGDLIYLNNKSGDWDMRIIDTHGNECIVESNESEELSPEFIPQHTVTN